MCYLSKSLCIEAGIASYNTVKMVALKKYEDVDNKVSQWRWKCMKMGNNMVWYLIRLLFLNSK